MRFIKIECVLVICLIMVGCGGGAKPNRLEASFSFLMPQESEVIINDTIGLSTENEYQYEIVDGPDHGELIGNNILSLTYRSSADYVGADEFTVNVNPNVGQRFSYKIMIEVVPKIELESDVVLSKLINPASQTAALLVRKLEFASTVPTKFSLTVTDSVGQKELYFSENMESEHRHLLWIFEENATFEVELLLTDEYGFSTDPILLGNVVTEQLPADMFQIEYTSSDQLDQEPGITMLLASEKGVNAHAYSIAVDNNGDVVGVFQDEFYGFTRDGSMLFFQPPVTFIEYEPLEGLINTVVLVDTSLAMHHDLKKLPNGNFLSLDRKDRTVASFPIDATDQSLIADVEVIDDVVIEIDPFGNTVNEWSMMDMLDPRRIGFLSLRKIRGSYDWGHANSVSYDEEQDSILVSLRAQDAIVSFDKTSGTLNYILGNHNNWDSNMQEYLLTPVGEVDWPYGQHDIQPLGQNKYSLFDNGNYRASPFSVVAGDTNTEATYSRSVVYEVDPVARTISTLFEFRPDPAIFARAVGSTQVLPETGNMLSNFGVLTEVADSTVKSAKIIETSGSDLPEVVSTIGVSNSISDWGVRVYRAWKLPVDYRIL